VPVTLQQQALPGPQRDVFHHVARPDIDHEPRTPGAVVAPANAAGLGGFRIDRRSCGLTAKSIGIIAPFKSKRPRTSCPVSVCAIAAPVGPPVTTASRTPRGFPVVSAAICVSVLAERMSAHPGTGTHRADRHLVDGRCMDVHPPAHDRRDAPRIRYLINRRMALVAHHRGVGARFAVVAIDATPASQTATQSLIDCGHRSTRTTNGAGHDICTLDGEQSGRAAPAEAGVRTGRHISRIVHGTLLIARCAGAPLAATDQSLGCARRPTLGILTEMPGRGYFAQSAEVCRARLTRAPPTVQHQATPARQRN
jgi:hypothetical protein